MRSVLRVTQEGNLACEIQRELNITMGGATDNISYLPDCKKWLKLFLPRIKVPLISTLDQGISPFFNL